ncbi:TolC family protein [Arcobacter cloacae]|uniref:Transporter n=1 Tax=Arcobacter cloacae TaxID=1054034 RepID=A0A6M8NHU7_9BACT|nr:TolC family protein [Arcobacter cloacae]QKF89331.1 RND family efflux system, outer membrane channel protein, TolC family [Arcobacter cloacae]RXI38292.1 transporter [Arcobacter cloacae]
MRRVVILPFLCSLMFANELDLLQEDKKELRKIDKEIIEKKYESSKDEWIGKINLNSSLGKDHDFTHDKTGDMSRSLGLSFSQSIFESGGIEYSIEYARKQLKSDLIAWENQNIALIQAIYETLLAIKKLKLQIEQSDYSLKNKDIELILKRIQYEAGRVDITELNNAIMSKNNQQKENISLKNSLKEKEYELSKYTSLKSNQIEIIDFEVVDKEKFLKDNLNIRYENSRVELLDTSYKQLKSTYLPKVTLNTNANYRNNQNEDDRQTGAVTLNMSMPIFDITKDSKIEKSKLEVLKQKVNVKDMQNELEYEYEQILTQINSYDEYEKTISENLKLYEDLITANQSSNAAGMSADYDLEILQNTQKINQYDLQINDINRKLQYTKLYFKTKANI